MSPLAANAESAVNAVWRLLLRIAVIVGLVYLGIHLRAIINTLLIGGVIAYCFEPIVEAMIRWRPFQQFHTSIGRFFQSFRRRKRGSPGKQKGSHILRLCATSYALLIFFILLWQGTVLVARPFQKQITDIYRDRDHIVAKYRKQVSPELQDRIEKIVNDPEVQKKAQESLMPVAAKGVASLRYVVEVVLLPVLAFYFILDGHKLKREFIALAPMRYRIEVVRMVRAFNQIMRSYVLGQFILCVLAGVIVGLILWALGVQYAFVMAVLAGVTRAIPIIGPIIGGIPIIALTYLDDPVHGLHKATVVLVFFTIMHFAESKFIMPLLIGEKVDLHAVVIIVVLLVGGEVGGMLLGGTLGALLGMFFAPPIASLLRAMIRRYVLKLPYRPVNPHRRLEAAPALRGLPPPLTDTLD